MYMVHRVKTDTDTPKIMRIHGRCSKIHLEIFVTKYLTHDVIINSKHKIHLCIRPSCVVFVVKCHSLNKCLMVKKNGSNEFQQVSKNAKRVKQSLLESFL